MHPRRIAATRYLLVLVCGHVPSQKLLQLLPVTGYAVLHGTTVLTVICNTWKNMKCRLY